MSCLLTSYNSKLTLYTQTSLLCNYQHFEVVGCEFIVTGKGAQRGSVNVNGTIAQRFQLPGNFAGNIITFVRFQGFFIAIIVLELGDVMIAKGHQVKVVAMVYRITLLTLFCCKFLYGVE